MELRLELIGEEVMIYGLMGMGSSHSWRRIPIEIDCWPWSGHVPLDISPFQYRYKEL